MKRMNGSSPWWYQHRPWIYWAIYLFGFFAGNSADAAINHRKPFPAFVIPVMSLHWSRDVILAVATLIVFLGWALRLWGSSYLSAEVVWNRDALQNRLLVDGPFRYVRNPLYLGNILQAIGVGVLASPVGWAFIVIGNIWFSAMLAAHEAGLMRARFGAVYDAYGANVRALIPRLTPATVEGAATAEPSVIAGVGSELLTFGLCVGMLAFTLTRAVNAFLIALAAGTLAQVILRRASHR
jgi:protein-S-isoprenylcysteine O-methyltransferase Ste14